MRPKTEQPTHRLLWPFGLALAAGLIVAACGSAAATPTPPPTPAPTPTTASTPTLAPTPTPTPLPSPSKGPATAQLTIAGDPAIAGSAGTISVQCNFPSIGGNVIILYDTNAAGLAVRVVLSPGTVSVRYASGSGKTYLDREFAGTGVTGFDPATGAQIDTSLNTAPYAGATGNLGTITSVKGSVDCGNQQPGTSTLTLTGSTAEGQLTGVVLNPVRVECVISSNTKYVQVIGVAQLGSIPALVFVDGTASGTFGVTLEPQGGKVAGYSGKAPGATLSQSGMHVSGDATESVAAGATAQTLTVSGDATCGAPFPA
jgi:hypothetical protein